MNPLDALSSIPIGLREPLLKEYRNIVANYSEHRWLPSELGGGLFCEIVFSILHGYPTGSYPSSPSKPRDFVSACRELEKNVSLPRSFQILIPRLLPALYEVRNNRGVGHVGGDVDPNHMDATFVLTNANWIMGELVRVLHTCSTSEAQELVDKMVELRVPLVWEKGDVRRILDPSLKQQQQILLLLASTKDISVSNLIKWIEVKNKKYFMKTIREMHTKRLIELDESNDSVELLPPGSKVASEIVAKKT
ncbi:MAG: hypothetical protein AAGA53_15865 [Pseudomonadota bacterium]